MNSYAMERVRGFSCLGDRASTCVVFEATVTARARCWQVKCMECDTLLYEDGCPLGLKGTVYKTYLMPAVFCNNNNGTFA